MREERDRLARELEEERAERRRLAERLERLEGEHGRDEETPTTPQVREPPGESRGAPDAEGGAHRPWWLRWFGG